MKVAADSADHCLAAGLVVARAICYMWVQPVAMPLLSKAGGCSLPRPLPCGGHAAISLGSQAGSSMHICGAHAARLHPEQRIHPMTSVAPPSPSYGQQQSDEDSPYDIWMHQPAVIDDFALRELGEPHAQLQAATTVFDEAWCAEMKGRTLPLC